jgi:hypothetical protein
MYIENIFSYFILISKAFYHLQINGEIYEFH